MDSSIVYWLKIIVGVGVVAGAIIYLIIYVLEQNHLKKQEEQAQSKNTPMITLNANALMDIDFSVQKKVNIPYQFMNLNDYPIIIEDSWMGVSTDYRVETDPKERANHWQHLKGTVLNVTVPKGHHTNATVPVELTPFQITFVNSKTPFYWYGECNYSIPSRKESWKYKFIIKRVNNEGVIGLKTVLNENTKNQ